MTTSILELGPAAEAVARLVAAVDDGQLGAPTPCPDYSVADLLDHVAGLAAAFVAAARKTTPEGGSQPPLADGSRLKNGWRDRIGADLASLAAAWRDPSAYEGQTEAGGVSLSGQEAALVALNEVVVHGWDLARSTGQDYAVDEASLAPCIAFGELFTDPEMRGNAFGPVVPTPAGAPSLDRLVGLMGRDPGWRPS